MKKLLLLLPLVVLLNGCSGGGDSGEVTDAEKAKLATAPVPGGGQAFDTSPVGKSGGGPGGTAPVQRKLGVGK